MRISRSSAALALLLLLSASGLLLILLIERKEGEKAVEIGRSSISSVTSAPPRTSDRSIVVTPGRSSGPTGIAVRNFPSFPPPANIGYQAVKKLRDLLRTNDYPHGVASRSLAFVIHHHHQPNASEIVEQLQDGDVAYFIKACKKYNDRARAMYDSWAKSVRSAYFSTDGVLDGIPRDRQIVSSMDTDAVKKYLKSAEPWEPIPHAASCALTAINLGRFLSDEFFPKNVKWLMVLDDDTFVVRKNLLEYLGAFSSSVAWYLGLSNAEIPDFALPGGRNVAVTATAPGVLYSRPVLDGLRRKAKGVDLSGAAGALDMCGKSLHKDDVLIGFLALLKCDAAFVARPDLRGYHFRALADPAHLKPLTIHAELQDVKRDAAVVFQDLQKKYG